MHCMAYNGLRHGGEFYAGGQWSGGLTFLRYIHNLIYNITTKNEL